MINKKFIIPVCTLFFSLKLFCAVLIKGDKDASESATFSFSIKNNVINPFGAWYVAANEDVVTGKEFTISRLNRGTTGFEAITPETVTLNGKVDQPNPLYGQKINTLALLRPSGGNDLLVTTTDANPAIVYLVQNTFNIKNMILVATHPLHDAVGAQSSGVVNLTTNILAYVFAAVKPAVGDFGDKNSGIALLARGDVKNETVFGEVDAHTGGIVPMPKALPLDKTSSLVNINSTELAAMHNTVAMKWDPVLQRLFIGLQTTSSAGINDGTRAVVVGKLIENGGLELFPIAPDSAFANGNTQNIVGVVGADKTITIHDISTMYTSTGLTYLIILGGNGTSSQTLFALPLVSSGNKTGTLANKNDMPENVYQDADVQKLIARNFTHPATMQSEMTQSTDSAAQIGGGALIAGNITNFILRDDTVYAYVGNNISTTRTSGIYSSQALFDASGKIKGWTQWQRAGGTTDFVFDGALNTFDGTLIYATGKDNTSVNTVFQTIWSDGNKQGLLPITTYFDFLFSVANGGIQSLQTFLPSTPGLSNISVMTAGGIGNITLVQTGMLENEVIIPTSAQEFEKTTTYENGTITDFPSSKIITITGGALDEIGPITATGFARNDSFGWLFVGGSHGLAVLTNPDGSGWSIAQEELGDQFDGFLPGMSFKSIGTYQFVKKILYEDNFLFVISNNGMDRINLTTSNFATNSLDVTTVATKESLVVVRSHGAVLDGVVSQACALIATTGGLVRIGDNKDIRLITSADDADWTPISIPETGGAPTQLLAATSTNQPHDLTRSTGGHLYVLTSNEGYNQSRINRFSVSPLAANESMQATTVQQFDDLFVKNIPSFFLNFGNFNSIFATDGGLYFASRCKNGAGAPRVVLTPGEPAPRVGTRNVGERSSTVAINLADGTEINALQRSQASGSWIVAGDFGMQVLE